MTWYRPRAIRVEAVRWLGEENCEEVFAFLDMEHPEGELDHSVIHLDSGDAHPGDWIVRCVEQAYWDYEALTAKEFEAEFEEDS